jgi:citrate synthase
VLARALDVLFILHADHEQNCGTTAMRVSVRPTPIRTLRWPEPPQLSTALDTAAPTRPSSRCSPRSAASTTWPTREVGQGRQGSTQGFGHRVYKNYDPRATIIKKTADEVFEVTGKNPLLDIALKLEEVALADDYFVSRKLYPNVDFYSGLIYQAMRLPDRDVHRAVRHSAHRRLAGSLA